MKVKIKVIEHLKQMLETKNVSIILKSINKSTTKLVLDIDNVTPLNKNFFKELFRELGELKKDKLLPNWETKNINKRPVKIKNLIYGQEIVDRAFTQMFK